MLPPRHPKGKHSHWDPPDKEWLNDQYTHKQKSAAQIALEVGACARTVLKWLRKSGIRTRNLAEACALMIGEKNPHWKGGIRPGTHKRSLKRRGVPKICGWCGQQGGRIELHHKNHDPQDGAPENLMYLCETCHRLETALWRAREKGKIAVDVEDVDALVIWFPYLSKED